MRGRKPGFKKILIGSYAVIVLFTLGFFSWRSFQVSEKALTKIAHDDMQNLLEARNEILDMSLQGIREASLNLLVDQQLYEIFCDLDWGDTVALLNANEDVKEILQKYFYSYQQISAVSLVTDIYTFGYGNAGFSFDESFFEGDIYKETKQKHGGVLFTPASNGHFSMLRMTDLNSTDEPGRIRGLGGVSPIPVLVIDFKNEVFGDELVPLLYQEESRYMVVTKDGVIVAHSDSSLAGSRVERAGEDEKNVIVCRKTSPVTEWTTVVTLSREMLMKDVLADIQKNLLLFLVVSVVFAATVSVFLTNKITGSIDQLIYAVKRMGEGDFDINVKNTNIPEFDYLVTGFNEMSERLRTLIEENYVIKIRQQESQIAILTTQLNPHFLHNTLNVIQLSNLNGNRNETGKMIVALSRMLHYTMDSREEMKLLAEDMGWLNQYIYIMKCRYGHEFQVNCEIEESLLDKPVPKLFIQPILENSILHAFKEKEQWGIIRITGKAAPENRMIFTIEDDGDGMDEEQLTRFFENSSESIGIKNVYNRLRLIYKGKSIFQMESRLGVGTKTTINIPVLHDEEE